MRVFVADYHVGSHTHALHFLLSGVARSGKASVIFVQTLANKSFTSLSTKHTILGPCPINHTYFSWTKCSDPVGWKK